MYPRTQSTAACRALFALVDVASRSAILRGMACLLVGAAGWAALGGQPSSAAEAAPRDPWYARTFFLLHLDHHTQEKMEVGRDADPAETARLIGLVKPDVIQIHAKGNPGWTTYPTKIGHTPPKLARDVMDVWATVARENGYVFSAYYNIGRDREVMRRHPAWNRVRANGEPYDNMLCYHSGVAEQYLWPMVDEILERYRPGGFWFDGSCFTVMNCYCDRCRERFRREQQLAAPKNPQQAGWGAYKEMQRQIYREFCAETAARIKRRDPSCLVAVNWAWSLRMPEEPPAGIDYFTGDHGSQVDELAPDAIWYDGQSLPFDLMTTVFSRDDNGTSPKPRLQLQQEMGIILAHGGRYFAWDNPTPETGLVAERYAAMARDLAPFLRARQPWCQGSRRVPDVSLFHGAAAHYEQSGNSPAAFPRQNVQLLAACNGLRRLHLTPEMVSDRRLEQGEIRGRLLILEDTSALAPNQRSALVRYVENGGRLLLTGKAVEAAQLPGVSPADGTTLIRRGLGKGEVFSLAQPLFGPDTDSAAGPVALAELMERILPPPERDLVCDGPATTEAVLREKGDDRILHLVNIAPGQREHEPRVPSSLSQEIKALPPAPTCQVSLRSPQRPVSVTLQPQDKPLTGWTWDAGRLAIPVPSFEVHQLVVVTTVSPGSGEDAAGVDGRAISDPACAPAEPVRGAGLHAIAPRTPQELQELFRYTGESLPLVSAHRGGPQQGFPENCLATFENTLRHTFAVLEVDPRYTQDGAIVLHHDASLDRTTTGRGRLADLSLQEVKQLRLKDPLGTVTGLGIPTLDEALEWARGKTILILDQKDVPAAARVKKIEEHQAEAHAMLIVYSLKEAQACHALNPNIMLEVMIGTRAQFDQFDQSGIPWRNIVAFVGHLPSPDAELCALIHDRGTTCIAGTSRNLDRRFIDGEVSDIRELEGGYRALLRQGVDVIETDIPVPLASLLFATGPVPGPKGRYFRAPAAP